MQAILLFQVLLLLQAQKEEVRGARGQVTRDVTRPPASPRAAPPPAARSISPPRPRPRPRPRIASTRGLSDRSNLVLFVRVDSDWRLESAARVLFSFSRDAVL